MLQSTRTGAAELLDVVSLVTQAVWTDLRRSGAAIEPTQWTTLRLLAARPCTMSEIARHKAVSLPTVSRSVDMLVKRGWVERFVDEADRRQTLVRLTAAGELFVQDAVFHAAATEPMVGFGRFVAANFLNLVRELNNTVYRNSFRKMHEVIERVVPKAD
jgi:DNA-binding MarR family transcriptional regulator